MDPLSRRRFLKISGATFGLAASGAGLATVARAVNDPAGGRGRGLRKIPTFCDISFWKCGAVAHV